MKVVHSPTPLPRVWKTLPGLDKALLLADIQITRGSRLRAKLIVFEKPSQLRSFWKNVLGKGDLGKGCVGAVNSLACEVVNIDEVDSHLEVDPVYFCVIGLVVTHIGMEIITHESIHAGFAYAKRVKAKNMWPYALELDEENVCYPASRIASKINVTLRDAGLYEIYEKHRLHGRKK